MDEITNAVTEEPLLFIIGSVAGVIAAIGLINIFKNNILLFVIATVILALIVSGVANGTI